MNHWRICSVLAVTTTLCGAAAAANGRVVKIDVQKVVPAKPVPGAAPYEIVSGVFHGELDPRDPRNAIITDIAAAPRNAQGLVEYSATFAIARPVATPNGKQVLFYDVPNRGNFMIGADPFGYIRVVSGWQGDLGDDPELQTLHVPVAHGKHGPLTGPVLVRFVDMTKGVMTVPIVGSIGRPTARPLPLSTDTHAALLTRQTSDGTPPVVIPPTDWSFGDCTKTAFPGQPDPKKVCLKDGFDPAYAYTLTYTGKDPRCSVLVSPPRAIWWPSCATPSATTLVIPILPAISGGRWQVERPSPAII